MYKLTDGIVCFYKRLPVKSEAHMPVIQADPASKRAFYFGDIGTSIQEHYESRLDGIEVERRIRILQRGGKGVAPGDIAEIGSVRYNVGRVAPKISKQGIPVIDITLEKAGGRDG